jgi:inhibitor of cysteine peptidase
VSRSNTEELKAPAVVDVSSLVVLVGVAFVALLFQIVNVADAQTATCDMPQDPNQPVLVSPGQMFSIALESQPGTGFSWTVSQAPDPAVVQPVSTTTMPAAVPRPGAPETQCFVFSAVEAGETRMQFQYARPFETDAPPARVQDVDVLVSSAGGSVPVQLPAN